ncbi:MAG: hypothetical protein ACTSYJ_02445 [Candidatus Thorarchaeota archaeon]
MKIKAMSAFALVLFIGSALSVGSGMQSAQAHSFQNQSVISSADGSDYNHLPKSILVYTEFADPYTGTNGELKNTLAVVNEYFLDDYQITNLTDYSGLASVIMNYDVFLIPEQELLRDENITSIGAAWNGVLEPFVNNGGVLVVLDCYGNLLSNHDGPSLQILNATGIITYIEGYAYPGSPLSVIDPNNALARGILTSPFPASDGTLRFNVTGATNVIDDGTLPVVGHITMGMGHIAILGFDLYTTGEAQEQILRNAIQLTRHVVFDQSHSPYNSINSALLNYSLDLVSEGFAVSAMSTWDPDMIDMCDVLILVPGTTVYNSTEADVIEDFVTSGGGLLIFTDYGTYGEEQDPVTNRFGFVRNETGYIYDVDDTPVSSYTAYNQTNFETHSIMLKVPAVELDRSGVLLGMPANAIPLITTDADGTVFYDDDTPAGGLVVAAAAGFGLGRVSVVADGNFLSVNTNADADSYQNYYDAYNDLFLLNSVLWASGAGAEEQIVVFDESHGRNWHLTASYYGFGNFLTENGYTIRWMDDWDPTLVEQADALIIQDGDTNYTTSELSVIVDYVASGGGLCLLGGQTAFGLQADLVGNEFGLDFNNTGYLADSDDYEISSLNIIYNATNFGNHPIMEGVSRIELYWSTAFISIGAGTSLVTTDTDGTSTWFSGQPADGLTVMTALEYNMGRVFASADYVFPKALSDFDGDGVGILYDSDNDILLQNVFRWLTENRAPTVEVISPNGGEVLNGTITVSWDAEDFDSDPLTFDVYYSDNNGVDWTVLASGLTGLTHAWNTTLHDDGTDYMIRVEVSDDQYSAIDISDAAFELDNFVGTGGPGIPLDPTLLLIIGAVVLVVVIILVIVKKKKK